MSLVKVQCTLRFPVFTTLGRSRFLCFMCFVFFVWNLCNSVFPGSKCVYGLYVYRTVGLNQIIIGLMIRLTVHVRFKLTFSGLKNGKNYKSLCHQLPVIIHNLHFSFHVIKNSSMNPLCQINTIGRKSIHSVMLTSPLH